MKGRLLDTRALKAHHVGGATGNMERAGRTESRRHGKTSGCFEKVHALLALCTRHPPPFGLPALLFARSSTLSSPYISTMAPSMLHRIADTWSVTRLRPQDAKVEEHVPYISFSLVEKLIALWSLPRLIHFICGFSPRLTSPSLAMRLILSAVAIR